MQLSFYITKVSSYLELEVVNLYGHLQPIPTMLIDTPINESIDNYLEDSDLEPTMEQLLDPSYWYKDLPMDEYHKGSSIYYLATHDLYTVNSYVNALNYYTQISTIKSIYPELLI